MIKSRESLEKDLTLVLELNLNEKNTHIEWMEHAEEKYGMPERVLAYYIHLRKSLIEADNFDLFILTDVIKPDLIKKYFSPEEIKSLSKEKWNIEKIEFPLRYQMTQINDEQFIGRISVKELMLLKEAQLINYNENAQRTMQHIVKGKTEYFKIALNKDAVYHIMESYESDLYIPNTITLNLPEDADFYYDKKKCQLVIKSLKYFDILDGYHRYVAMSKLVSKYPDFDYDMELRIVQFDESKEKRFIWQEDQKTKMRKVDSDAMDTTKASNKIVERLNMQSDYLGGRITRNNGIVNAAYLANIIDVIMLKGIKKSDERLAIGNISSEIQSVFNTFISNDESLALNPWSKLFTYMMIYEIKYGNPNDIEAFYNDLHIVEEDGSIYKNAKLTNTDVTRTHKLLGREGY